MNWIKRLFGIKEVEETVNNSVSYTEFAIAKQKRIREIVEAERIRRDEIYERSLKKAREDESSFLTSMAAAAVTDSTVVGALVGGDIFGAIVGDALNDNDSNSNSDSGFDGGFGGGDFSGGGSGGSWDDSSSSSSDSYDSSSSYDSGSSYDSSDSSSSDW